MFWWNWKRARGGAIYVLRRGEKAWRFILVRSRFFRIRDVICHHPPLSFRNKIWRTYGLGGWHIYSICMYIRHHIRWLTSLSLIGIKPKLKNWRLNYICTDASLQADHSLTSVISRSTRQSSIRTRDDINLFGIVSEKLPHPLYSSSAGDALDFWPS